MNNSKTPKIVVGVGLAAIYATGAAFLMPHGASDNVVSQSASMAPPAEIVSESAPPPAIAPAPADVMASAEQSSAASAAATSAAPTAPVVAVAKTEQPAPRTVEAKPQVSEQPIAKQEPVQEPVVEERPIASVATVPPAAEREVEDPSLASSGSADLEDREPTAEVASELEPIAPESTSEAAAEDEAVLSE